jgi:hypothetical protein
MTGEDNYKKAPWLKLDEVRLQGEQGKFVFTELTGEKGEDGKYPSKIHESPLELVFLAIRKQKIEQGDEGTIRITNEYRNNESAVVVYDKKTNTTTKLIGSEVYNRFEGMRTVEVVYARFAGKIVRFRVKGASLGSKVKNKEVTKFYDYLASFTGNDHFYNFKTRISAVEEKGMKAYFVINFQRGERLSADQQEAVITDIERVYEFTSAYDEHYGNSPAVEPAPTAEVDAGIEYPAEDINPDDIPF